MYFLLRSFLIVSCCFVLEVQLFLVVFSSGSIGQLLLYSRFLYWHIVSTEVRVSGDCRLVISKYFYSVSCIRFHRFSSDVTYVSRFDFFVSSVGIYIGGADLRTHDVGIIHSIYRGDAFFAAV